MNAIFSYLTDMVSNYFNQFLEMMSVYLIPLGIILFIFLVALAFKKKFANLIINLIHTAISKGPFPVEKTSLSVLKKPLQNIFMVSMVFLSVALQGQFRDNNPGLMPLMLLIYRLVIIISITYLLYEAVPVVANIINRKREQDDSAATDNTLMIFFSKIVRGGIIIISLFIILGEFGVNLGGLIAGAGIGGLVLALASQDTAANLFGGLVIISDKPFSVGDWIQTPSVDGIVEDITFRSTRIRTFEDSLLVVPNSALANSAITNWSKMTKRRINFNIGLTYDTHPDTIKVIMNQILKVLNDNNQVVENSAIVRLDDFGDSSLDIVIIYYVNQIPLTELKRVREEINFEILNIVNSSDSSFAFPSTSVYIEKQ